MKLISFTMIICLLSLPTFSQGSKRRKRRRVRKAKLTRVIKQQNTEKEAVKDIELLIAYKSNEINEVDGTKSSGKGIQLGIGKIFNLDSGLATTSQFSLNYISYDVDNEGLAITNESLTKTDLQFSQRLGYNIENGGVIIKPFIDAGASYGLHNLEFTTGGINYGIETSYVEYGGSLGLQIDFGNGFIPFVKYNVSKLILSDTSEIEASAGSNTANVTINNQETKKERTSDSKTLVLGLGFRF